MSQRGGSRSSARFPSARELPRQPRQRRSVIELQKIDLRLGANGRHIAPLRGVRRRKQAPTLGIARALCSFDLELRGRLKKDGLLTRDARAKERKKYGLAGARKRFQFSKR